MSASPLDRAAAQESTDWGHDLLSGDPDPATVFDAIDQTYLFDNNLTNSIWNRPANRIVTGDFSQNGYWAFAPGASPATSPDNDTTRIYARLVQIPLTSTVVFTSSPSNNGIGVGDVAHVRVASISSSTGLISGVATAVFEDGFNGACQLLSSSNAELLCYDGTSIRRYATSGGSPNLAATGTVSLSVALPAAGRCNPGAACYGGTFAWDGKYYYFATDQGSPSSLSYSVYDATGTFVATHTVTGTGSINGTYFDWSVARYSTHDGWGGRLGSTVFGTGSDSHNFGPASPYHFVL